jgi:hypothetical protein
MNPLAGFFLIPAIVTAPGGGGNRFMATDLWPPIQIAAALR